MIHDAPASEPASGVLVVEATSSSPRPSTGFTIEIAGRRLQAEGRRTSVELPTGDHEVTVATRYFWTLGRARLTVPIRAGETTTVFYTEPIFVFGRGALGLEPQAARGRALVRWTLVLAGVALAIALVWMLITSLG